jgi:hypothetical protein
VSWRWRAFSPSGPCGRTRVAAGSVLPAGSYRVVVDAADPDLTLLYSANGETGVPILTGFGSNVATDGQATFAFRKLGGYYFLSEIKVPGAYDRIVPLTTKTMTTQVARLQAEADHALGGTQH